MNTNKIIILNTKLLSLFIVGTLLSSCGNAKKVTKNLAINSPIETAINLNEVVNDKAPVIINPGVFTVETVTYRLPKVIPGTYSVSNFGSFIDDFKAFDYKGKEMNVVKKDANSWVISNATKLDKITYLVNDTFDLETVGGIGKDIPFSPAGTNIESSNYVLNLHGFIGYFDSLKNNQYKLEVTASADLLRTSALQTIDSKLSEDGKNKITSYFAPRYFDIMDNPMMYGELDVEEFLVDDIKIVLSVYSPNKVHSAKSLKETIYDMMKAQKAYLGAINSTPRYDIYLYLSEGKKDSPKGFGALEHHTSTVVVLPENMPKEALIESMIDVVSHEFFHIVTPLNVHSEDIHYFDYNNPTFSKHLWMYEGVTEYFATLFQVSEGLVDDTSFYSKIITKIQRASRMDDAMSFTNMSENILKEPYKDQYVNVYQKGALIGMCIDILMREESNGNRGILSLMKELSNKYGTNKPFEDDKLIDEIAAMTYPSVKTFLDTHVVGTTPINYNDFFDKVGLEMKESSVETNYLLLNGTPIVTGDRKKGTIFFTDMVLKNSFWAENGAKPNDIIKVINGTSVTLQNANTVFQEMFSWTPGIDIEVVLDRDGKDIEIKTKTTKAYTTGTAIFPKATATKKQIELRNSWLKG